MDSRDSEGVPFAVTRHLADTVYSPWRVPKSGHVTITKIENLHIDTRRNFTDSKNAILFDLQWTITKLLRKPHFRTVASLGICERLAVLNWCSSSFLRLFCLCLWTLLPDSNKWMDGRWWISARVKRIEMRLIRFGTRAIMIGDPKSDREIVGVC